MNTPYVFKRCSKCKKWLVANTINFSRRKGLKYGLNYQCKKCWNSNTKQYKRKNYIKARLDRFNNSNKIRYKNNNISDKFTKITYEQVMDMITFFDNKCAYSGIELDESCFSMDHMNPVKKEGLNVIWNIVPCHKIINIQKSDTSIEDWYIPRSILIGCHYYSEERLQKIRNWQKYAFEKYGNKKELAK